VGVLSKQRSYFQFRKT